MRGLPKAAPSFYSGSPMNLGRLTMLTGLLSLMAADTFAATQPAGFVNSKLCAGCHADVDRHFRQTGMAQAFGKPTRENTIAGYKGRERFYHPRTRMYYSMLERDGKFYQRRWRVGPGGKLRDVDESRIDFIMGSGNHVRTYLHRTSTGTLVELPLAWYSEKGGYLALNPGYDADHFIPPRLISYDCMFCHNAYPKIPAGYEQLNRMPVYVDPLPEGIDCQRCHGPGAEHVQAAQRPGARKEDLQKTILNPARLSGDRQMEVCMQCHLQTTSSRLPSAIRRYDRGPFSYRAGEPLGDFILNFDKAPNARAAEQFGIVNSAYRLRQSQCWTRSEGRLTCLTCHDPHRSQHGQPAKEHYNAVCTQCHSTDFTSHVKAGRHTTASDCVACHMPERRTDDVVHVVMTDHYIQRNRPTRDLLAEIPEQQETEQNARRGEVVPYYPDPFPATAENSLYQAVAQVDDGSNLSDGIRQLSAELATQKSSSSAVFYFKLGEAWRDQGKSANSILPYEDAVTRDPGSGWMLRRLGDALRSTGDTAGARQALKQAVQAWPEDGRIWYGLGAIEWQTGHATDSIAAFRKALLLDPELPYVQYSLGRALGNNGDLHAAELEYRVALQIQPDFAEAQVSLATALSARGVLEEASEYFQSALVLRPDNAPARCQFALTLAAMNRTVEAKNQVELAILTNPSIAEPHRVLGEVLEKSGHTQDAIKAYREAIRLKPGFSQAQLELGEALNKQGNHAEALAYLRSAATSPDAAVHQKALRALHKLSAQQ